MKKFFVIFSLLIFTSVPPLIAMADDDADEITMQESAETQEEQEEYEDEDETEYEYEDEETEPVKVAERFDCDKIKAQIDELGAVDELSEEELDQLNDLKILYRASCMKKAAGRRTLRAKSTVVAVERSKRNVVAESGEIAKTAEEKPKEEPKEKPKEEPKEAEKTEVPIEKKAEVTEQQPMGEQEKKPEQEQKVEEEPKQTAEEDLNKVAAYIKAGLCADGSKPNKFGCCKGEKFRDLGNLLFACCPEDGGDCFPPIEKPEF